MEQPALDLRVVCCEWISGLAHSFTIWTMRCNHRHNHITLWNLCNAASNSRRMAPLCSHRDRLDRWRKRSYIEYKSSTYLFVRFRKSTLNQSFGAFKIGLNWSRAEIRENSATSFENAPVHAFQSSTLLATVSLASCLTRQKFTLTKR